jgi:sec-independent protein translocase protein TatC
MSAPATGEPQAEPPEDQPMTVLEHLGELRTRAIKSVLGMIPGIAVAWVAREHLLEFLIIPLAGAWRKLGYGTPTLHFANPVDLFVAYIKIAIAVGLIFAAPWILWQIWGFVAPGLYQREKRYAVPFILGSTVCFIGGAFFGYAYVFPLAFEMLLEMAGMLPSDTIKVQPTIMIDQYLSFATRMLLGFGVVFEIPVVVTLLASAGVVNWKQLLSFGRWWVLIAAVLAALLTPPDVGSQGLMLAPLILLYFLSVAIAYVIGPKPEPEPEPEPESESETTDDDDAAS